MITILADATLPLLTQAFPAPFQVQTYTSRQELEHSLSNQATLLCRSTLKVDAALLKQSALKYVATASSGSDHLDKDFLQQKQIPWLDAKGCNAHSVADYVLCILAALRRAGIDIGLKAGVIGRGAVGLTVLKRLQILGFETVVFDPPLALRDTRFTSCSLEELTNCNILFIHAELHDDSPWPSRNLLNKDFLLRLQPKTVLINASRGDIVNEKDLLQLPFKVHYCTDVYSHEPDISHDIVQYATFCTPHIAGHSIEGKENAVKIISHKLHALYGLKPPVFPAEKSGKPIVLEPSAQLDAQLLALYDPALETALLKNPLLNAEIFQQIRSNHNQRQDFFILESNTP